MCVQAENQKDLPKKSLWPALIHQHDPIFMCSCLLCMSHMSRMGLSAVRMALVKPCSIWLFEFFDLSEIDGLLYDLLLFFI